RSRGQGTTLPSQEVLPPPWGGEGPGTSAPEEVLQRAVAEPLELALLGAGAVEHRRLERPHRDLAAAAGLVVAERLHRQAHRLLERHPLAVVLLDVLGDLVGRPAHRREVL